ncbi:hypothetical protein [Streptomyces sp. WMMC940]|nr:hypothetical protein [Streptomyces sp. WMMC940]MCZ7460571.1 hypothetical protein [Streptomyces sp. WMMC940]
MSDRERGRGRREDLVHPDDGDGAEDGVLFALDELGRREDSGAQ